MSYTARQVNGEGPHLWRPISHHGGNISDETRTMQEVYTEGVRDADVPCWVTPDPAYFEEARRAGGAVASCYSGEPSAPNLGETRRATRSLVSEGDGLPKNDRTEQFSCSYKDALCDPVWANSAAAEDAGLGQALWDSLELPPPQRDRGHLRMPSLAVTLLDLTGRTGGRSVVRLSGFPADGQRRWCRKNPYILADGTELPPAGLLNEQTGRGAAALKDGRHISGAAGVINQAEIPDRGIKVRGADSNIKQKPGGCCILRASSYVFAWIFSPHLGQVMTIFPLPTGTRHTAPHLQVKYL